MKYKHISIILKIIRHINIYQNRKSLCFNYKKEFLPILFFLKKESLIYNYKIINLKYILITFKFANNINFLKKIKVFNFTKHSFTKKIILELNQNKNIFKFIFLVNKHGIFSLKSSILKNMGGYLIAAIN